MAYERCDWADQRDRYDRVVDLIASRSPYRVHGALRACGSYLMVGGRTRVLLATFAAAPVLRGATGKRVGVLMVPQSRADLEEVTALVADGAVVPAIDAVCPLEEAPAAFARLAAGDNLGKLVVEVP
ncbi:zinc-binding dehydrogenase [Promicromonospora sp. NPDC059942]|uniref:zinc-binding dehydrogenase n=1 Tax=Promicromonospora sp. NPDC059942 TaxID=3347009 RepID=UPI00365A9BF8